MRYPGISDFLGNPLNILKPAFLQRTILRTPPLWPSEHLSEVLVVRLSPSPVILPKRLCPLVFPLRGKGKAGRGRLLVLSAEASNE